MVKPSAIFLAFFLFINLTCSSNPTQPPGGQTIGLTILDVSSTETFLNITTNNITLPANVTLIRNDQPRLSLVLTNSDTTIVDNNLNPNQTYTYRVELTDANNQKAVSENVQAQTLDTTSHNFTWQTFTFGGLAGSSTLYDVAIINENDIWAVGEIYMNDSTGQPDPILYNAVHWDGSKWELKRIPFEYNGQNLFSAIYAVFAFNKDDIWFGIGNMIHWNGVEYLPVEIPTSIWGPHLINKIWGISSKDFYVVGDKGSIAHYINGYWQKLISGTNLNVNDIWGDFNQTTGKYEILAVASNIFSTPDRAILSIDPATRIVTQLSSQPIQYTLKGIWFYSNKQYFVSGDGIFQKHILSDNSWANNPLEITSYFINKIRGNDINDVVAVGAFGEVLHYNGVNWKSYRNATKINDGAYYSVETGSNLVVGVGQDNPAAVLIIGKR